MKLPKDSDTPPYRLVAEELRRQIRSGRLKPGERVPSSRDLEATYEIANMTARSALRVLRDEGLIYSMPGRGNFVADPLPAESAPKGGAPEAASGGRMPTPEYIELSERLDAINARLDSLLQVFQQLGGVMEAKQSPKK
ncbi:GntR family transcriptional regulator [Streptomyces sp. B93]|uniref:GntR family transcriptional regulator n=1 Tax=Streptomyces sp. B93 TaxID=2824875 RepID=UPI001B38CC74|nr:GntR family transcriptional regulator [Streptomyces sp. B93]MBQ1091755.1 GntR family transcriptional regulator [Streptomyces sp. B93]